MAELKIQFLDVGQGDGIFIEFPGGATMLVDLGTTKNGGITTPDILTYFKNHTKFGNAGETLDYLILTHGDQDHFNMVLDFIVDRKVNVARLLFSGFPSDYTRPYQTVNEIDKIKTLCPGVVILSAKHYPVRLPTEISTFGPVKVDVLAVDVPPTSKKEKPWRKNTGSVVLQLEYGAVRIILAGDATSDTEEFISGFHRIMKSESMLRSHVLKLGHHGSHRTSNTAQWIKGVNPALVFISADRHGFLSDAAKATGHRLPQSLTLSLIAKHSPALYAKCEPHNVIAAFDSADYDKYNLNPDIPNDKVSYNVPGKSWVEENTQLGIFTSLVAMDKTQGDASVADQGDQFQLSVSDQNVIEVTSALNPKVLAKFQV